MNTIWDRIKNEERFELDCITSGFVRVRIIAQLPE